jgi:cytochrome c biogenesis protein CcdA
MIELQQFLAQWIGGIASLLPLGYAFGAGMVATVNPCGFAMLPAYLGLYLGSRELASSPGAERRGIYSSPGAEQRGIHSMPSSAVTTSYKPTLAETVLGQMTRALGVTAGVAGGFVLLFGSVGLLLSAGGQLIIRFVPWIALIIGIALVFMGLAMLRGWHLSAPFVAQLTNRLGNPGTTTIWGFFLFGVAYALTSLSCTLPVFLAVVGSSLTTQGFTAMALQFVSYSLGMGLVILILTLGMALFKGATIGFLHRTLPIVERLSAILLILAGAYITYYWLFKGGLIRTIL